MPLSGITTWFADPSDIASFETLVEEKTKAIFAETVGNPLGNVTDIAALAEIAHRRFFILLEHPPLSTRGGFFCLYQ